MTFVVMHGKWDEDGEDGEGWIILDTEDHRSIERGLFAAAY